MIDNYTEEQVNELLISDKFMKDYQSYEKEVDVEKLSNFFDDIETNKNYFRLNIKKLREKKCLKIENFELLILKF